MDSLPSLLTFRVGPNFSSDLFFLLAKPELNSMSSTCQKHQYQQSCHSWDFQGCKFPRETILLGPKFISFPKSAQKMLQLPSRRWHLLPVGSSCVQMSPMRPNSVPKVQKCCCLRSRVRRNILLLWSPCIPLSPKAQNRFVQFIRINRCPIWPLAE